MRYRLLLSLPECMLGATDHYLDCFSCWGQAAGDVIDTVSCGSTQLLALQTALPLNRARETDTLGHTLINLHCAGTAPTPLGEGLRGPGVALTSGVAASWHFWHNACRLYKH